MKKVLCVLLAVLMAATLLTACGGKTPAGEADFDTRQVRQVLGGVSLAEPAVVAWMKEALEETINPIFGGV